MNQQIRNFEFFPRSMLSILSGFNILIVSVLGCGKSHNSGNENSRSSHHAGDYLSSRSHHIWRSPWELTCQNGEVFPSNRETPLDSNVTVNVDHTAVRKTVTLACRESNNAFGLTEAEYTFELSLKEFRKHPNKPIGYAYFNIVKYPDNFVADLNKIANDEGKKDLCLIQFMLNVGQEAAELAYDQGASQLVREIDPILLSESNSPLVNLGFPRSFNMSNWEQQAFLLGASSKANIPLCERANQRIPIGLSEARHALADSNIACKKQILETYLVNHWITPRCSNNTTRRECRKSQAYVAELVSLLNENKRLISSSVNDVNLNHIWASTQNKHKAWLRIVGRITTEALQVGQSKVVQNLFTPFQSLISYGLIRNSEKDYTAVVNVRFQEGCTLNTNDSSDFLREYRRRVNECLTSTSPYLYRARGHSLTIELYDPSIHTSLPAVPENIVAVYPESGAVRANSGAHPFNLECETILHETIHLLGLVDEYQEDEHSLGRFRQRGPNNSIMSHQYTRWDYVFSEETNQNNRSLLSPMHFLMITHHNKPMAGIEDYLVCSADAYTANFKPRTIPVSALPSSCRNGSTNWITHPRTNSQ